MHSKFDRIYVTTLQTLTHGRVDILQLYEHWPSFPLYSFLCSPLFQHLLLLKNNFKSWIMTSQLPSPKLPSSFVVHLRFSLQELIPSPTAVSSPSAGKKYMESEVTDFTQSFPTVVEIIKISKWSIVRSPHPSMLTLKKQARRHSKDKSRSVVTSLQGAKATSKGTESQTSFIFCPSSTQSYQTPLSIPLENGNMSSELHSRGLPFVSSPKSRYVFYL